MEVHTTNGVTRPAQIVSWVPFNAGRLDEIALEPPVTGYVPEVQYQLGRHGSNNPRIQALAMQEPAVWMCPRLDQPPFSSYML